MATDILGKVGEKVGTEIKAVNTTISNHANRGDNPHSVNKSQVGLGNVQNIAVNTWAGSTNLTTVGTLSAGTIPYSLLSGAPSFDASGNLSITGNLTVGGTRTVLNTQTVEVEDNIIEVNLTASDGSETAQTGGIQINRGKDNAGAVLDKAQFIWDDGNDLFHLKKGTADANLKVGIVQAGKLKVGSGSDILINNVSLGNYASFESAFTTALS
tara:strand:- start:4095 stop:4733 length:639 start_codon:yes stop_codon:yes gene_type:complete